MTLKRTGFKPRTTPMGGSKGAAFARTERKEKAASSKAARGMKAKRPASTADEKRHLAAVAALGCILCQHLDFGPTPAEIHHVRERHGWGRSGHFNTIGLCPTHHRGQPFGIHDMGRQEFTAYYGISEMDLLAMVMRRLNFDGHESVAADSRPKQNPSEEYMSSNIVAVSEVEL